MSPEDKNRLSIIKKRFFAKSNEMMDEHRYTDNLVPELIASVYPDTTDITVLYDQLSDLKRCLDSFRPFNPMQKANLQSAFDAEYTYESNRIEGNTLSLMETELVIHKGMTIEGKPLKDHFEAVNHLQAIDYIRGLVQDNVPFDEQSLLKLQGLILQGIDPSNAGSYRRGNVRIVGSQHVCPNFYKVPDLMAAYFAFYATHKNRMHPVELAAEMHERLVSIHPFIDGNGRTARLLMNLILLNHGFPITVIASDRPQRTAYYIALETAQISQPKNDQPFKLLVAGYVKTGFVRYLELLAFNLDEQDKGCYFFNKMAPLLET